MAADPTFLITLFILAIAIVLVLRWRGKKAIKKGSRQEAFRQTPLADPNQKGLEGEADIWQMILRQLQLGLEGRVLRNVYIPRDKGGTSEIDILLICSKGIFVFESKNYMGYIFGNSLSKEWTVTLNAGRDMYGNKHSRKIRFYNPVWQNKTHIKYLSQLIDPSYNIEHFYSVIVFSDRGSLMNVTYDPNEATIIHTSQLPVLLMDIQGMPDVLSTEQIQSIFEKFLPLTQVSVQQKQEHIERIQEQLSGPGKCPWCGGDLVLRTAKSGPRAGNSFYGCSNYPRCKFIRNITQ